MTPREHLRSLVADHGKDLANMHRLPLLLLPVIVLYVASDRWAWMPKEIPQIIVAVVAISVLVYARRWRQKADWLKRFSCPQCGESLKCFLQNPQHYQLTQGKGIPDSVKKCPSCSLDFDAEFPGLESDERKPA